MKAIEQREPLTEQEVFDFLEAEVQSESRQWGPDYIYTRWARERRDKWLAAFREGQVVPVKRVSYVDKYGNGCGDYEDVLYSDGHVETMCYGFLD